MSINNTSYQQWLNHLIQCHLPRWNDLPDLFLYKDQVVSLVETHVSPFAIEDNLITPAMINNYVKQGLLPKPDHKKRYDRTHVAYLIAITLLKAVLPLKMINDAIVVQAKIEGLRRAYDHFCEGIENAIAQCVQTIDAAAVNADSPIDENNLMLIFGCQAFASKLIAMKYVAFSKMKGENENG